MKLKFVTLGNPEGLNINNPRSNGGGDISHDLNSEAVELLTKGSTQKLRN